MRNSLTSLLILAFFAAVPNIKSQGFIGNFSGKASGIIGNVSVAEGTQMNGYWIFHTNVDAQQYFFQQSTSPVFAITVEGHGTFVLPIYEIHLGNDSLAMGYGGLADSYTVGSYAIDPTAPPGLQAMLGLSTSDLNVFSNETLPLNLPAASAFNLYNNWSLQNGSPEDADYWAVGGQLDSVSINPVPEPSPGILLAGGGIAFFLLNRFKKREKQV